MKHTLIDGLARRDQAAFREFVELYKKRVYFLALDMVGNAVDAGRCFPGGLPQGPPVFRDVQEGRQAQLLGLPGHLQRLHRPPQEEGTHPRGRRRRGPRGPDQWRRVPAWSAAPRPTPAAPLKRASSRPGSPGPWNTVSPQEKAVFLLRHYDELMLKEIAEALHLSIGSVKSYLFRAVRKLQKELGSPRAPPGWRFPMISCRKSKDMMIEALYGELPPAEKEASSTPISSPARTAPPSIRSWARPFG